MANTPGFTVDLNRYEIPDKAKFVTQDRGGRVVFWADRPKTYLDGGAWTGSYLKTLCTGPVNTGWQNAIIKWPLRDPGGQKNDSDKPRLDALTEESGTSRNIADALVDVNHPYHTLAVTLADAFDQAASGKGHERHGKGAPFNEQRMQTIAHGQGHIGGLIYQICKKAQECERMETEARRRELHGVIVYAAGALIAS